MQPWTLPISWPDETPGDGFWIRHGYACENTWYNPGWWHTGEDWYAVEGETGGAHVLAVTAGTVVFTGSEYPGRVVIVEHLEGLYSMYGHLDYDLPVAEGDEVAAGQSLGTILYRTDGRAPSHLHFEIRDFLFNGEVNGLNPRYEVGCRYQCAPGPGYWPIDAPEHPSKMGWRNPSHVLAASWVDAAARGQMVAVAPSAGNEQLPIVAAPGESETVFEIGATGEEHFFVLDVRAGSADSTGTGAEAYDIWLQLELGDGNRGWTRAAVPTPDETGSNGDPSSLRWLLLPEAAA